MSDSKFIETGKTEIVLCKYTFSEEELKEVAGDMAEAIAEKDKLAEQLKAVAARYKASIQKHEADYRLASQRIKNGYEMREVECFVELTEGGNEVLLIRKDNGQIAARRPAQSDEKQMKLRLA